MEVDEEKIIAMVSWLTPINLKELRGFFGFTGYYPIVKGCAQVAKEN